MPVVSLKQGFALSTKMFPKFGVKTVYKRGAQKQVLRMGGIALIHKGVPLKHHEEATSSRP